MSPYSALLAALGQDLGVHKLVGRLQEQVVLGTILRGNEPEFLALYGRRRVGKTFLIREFFQETIRFELFPWALLIAVALN